MLTYKVDLDYESYLFDPNYLEDSLPYLKIIREFEYIFFLINKDPNCGLKNTRDYDINHLEKLKKLGFVIPKLIPHERNFIRWWGNHHDYNLEQDLNSKITSAKLAKAHGWGFLEGAIVESVAHVREHLSSHPVHHKWILKRPHSFSGIGHYQFEKDKINEFILSKILNGPTLLEPLYQRVFDIGTTFEVENGVIVRQFMVENFNGEQGGFRGGSASSSMPKFKNYILEKYNFDLSELEIITQEIAQAYLKMGALKNIQIDSFIFSHEGQMKLYALVEVNYRKTMGLVIQALADKYDDCSRIEWRVNTKKEIELDKNFYQDSKMIRLSPDGVHFQTFLKYFS